MKQEENVLDPYDVYMKREEKRKRYKTLFFWIGLFFLTGCIAAALNYNHTKQFYERKIPSREEMEKIEGNLESCEEMYSSGGKLTPDYHYFKIIFQNGEEHRVCRNILSEFDQNGFQQLKRGSKVTLLLDESQNKGGVNGFEVAEVYSHQKYYLTYEDYVNSVKATQKFYRNKNWFFSILVFMLCGGGLIGITLLWWNETEKERKAKESEVAAAEVTKQESH